MSQTTAVETSNPLIENPTSATLSASPTSPPASLDIGSSALPDRPTTPASSESPTSPSALETAASSENPSSATSEIPTKETSARSADSATFPETGNQETSSGSHRISTPSSETETSVTSEGAGPATTFLGYLSSATSSEIETSAVLVTGGSGKSSETETSGMPESVVSATSSESRTPEKSSETETSATLETGASAKSSETETSGMPESVVSATSSETGSLATSPETETSATLETGGSEKSTETETSGMRESVISATSSGTHTPETSKTEISETMEGGTPATSSGSEVLATSSEVVTSETETAAAQTETSTAMPETETSAISEESATKETETTPPAQTSTTSRSAETTPPAATGAESSESHTVQTTTFAAEASTPTEAANATTEANTTEETSFEETTSPATPPPPTTTPTPTTTVTTTTTPAPTTPAPPTLYPYLYVRAQLSGPGMGPGLLNGTAAAAFWRAAAAALDSAAAFCADDPLGAVVVGVRYLSLAANNTTALVDLRSRSPPAAAGEIRSGAWADAVRASLGVRLSAEVLALVQSANSSVSAEEVFKALDASTCGASSAPSAAAPPLDSGLACSATQAGLPCCAVRDPALCGLAYLGRPPPFDTAPLCPTNISVGAPSQPVAACGTCEWLSVRGGGAARAAVEGLYRRMQSASGGRGVWFRAAGGGFLRWSPSGRWLLGDGGGGGGDNSTHAALLYTEDGAEDPAAIAAPWINPAAAAAAATAAAAANGTAGNGTAASPNASSPSLPLPAGAVDLHITCMPTVEPATATLGAELDRRTVWAFGMDYFGELGAGPGDPGVLSTQGVAEARPAAVGSGDLRTTDRPLALPGGPGLTAAAPGGPAPPSPLAMGCNHALKIDAAGAVWAWGANENGQLGLSAGAGEELSAPAPALLPGFGSANSGGGGPAAPAVSAVAGASFSLVLDSDGVLWSFGGNQYGQLGRQSSAAFDPTPGPVNFSSAVADSGPGFAQVPSILFFAAGHNHALAAVRPAVAARMLLLSWGANDFGQLGRPVGAGTPVLGVAPGSGGEPRALGADALGGEEPAALALGPYHSVVLTANGSVFCFGSNLRGQCGPGGATGGGAARPGSAEGRSLPARLPRSLFCTNSGEMCAFAVAAAAGRFHTLLLVSILANSTNHLILRYKVIRLGTVP